MNQEQIDISPDTDGGTVMSDTPKKSHKRLWTALLILLLVSAIAAAGWKWYGQISEYQMEQNDSQQQITELQKKLAALSADKALAVDGGDKQIKMEYPADWVLDKTSHETGLVDNNTTVEDATLTSPSGNTLIRVQTGVSGIGGACIASEQPNSLLDFYQTTELPKTKNHSFVEYYSKGGKVYGSHVALSESIKAVKQGDNICDIAFSEFMGANDTQGIYMITIVSPEIALLQGKNKLPTLDQMKKFFASTEYKVAKKIVLSAQITKK